MFICELYPKTKQYIFYNTSIRFISTSLYIVKIPDNHHYQHVHCVPITQKVGTYIVPAKRKVSGLEPRFRQLSDIGNIIIPIQGGL